MLNGCYNKQTPKTISEIDNRKLILRILKNEQLPKTTIVDKIKYQLEWLGYSELNDVKQPMTIWIVTDLSTTSYGTQYVTMYNICYGVSKTYRINKAFWTKHPFAISDVIECCFREKDKYIKDENGNFRSTGEKILELKAWKSVENIA
jgi:hypothetical protein